MMTTEERDAKTFQSYADAQAGQKSFAQHHADTKAWHEEWLGGAATVQAVTNFEAAERAQMLRESNIDINPTQVERSAEARRQFHIDDDAR